MIGSLALRRYGVRCMVGSAKRCFGRVASIDTPSILTLRSFRNPRDCFSSLSSSFIHSRQFLGCADGEEGVLSKIYEERIAIGYSPEQLFDVVAAVDLYHGFVRWCQRSEIIKYNPDGSFDAELEIGFKFLVESYVSHVELSRPKCIKSSLFDHLINIWEFNPGPVPGSCDLYFLVDFKFQSPLYRQIASMFFKEAVSKLVGSFSECCQLIYGPGLRVLEKEQRA